jgi:hypothetical protein
MIKGKVKAIPDQVYYRPIGFQESEAPRFLDNGHMNVVRLSVLITDHIYPRGSVPGIHFC